MEAPDFGDLHDPAHLRPLDRPPVWRGLLEREMGSGAVIVREVRGQKSAQMPLAEHDEMVEALAPHGADEAFRKRILPRTARRREDFRMRMPLTRWRNGSPKTRSRSRRR